MLATTTNPDIATATATRASAARAGEGAIRGWLRLEGVAAFVAGLALFGVNAGNWLFLVPLLLAPDISAVGYARGPRVGAAVYNAVHNWAVGLAVLAMGLATGLVPLVLAGAILVAHVGMDRAAGYGLKFATSF